MFVRNHKPLWSKEELDIMYKNYWKMNEYELAGLLPNRSLCAVKNKIKQLKYGKYRKRRLVL